MFPESRVKVQAKTSPVLWVFADADGHPYEGRKAAKPPESPIKSRISSPGLREKRSPYFGALCCLVFGFDG